MNELGTNRQQLAGELADTRRGCECPACLGEAERFIVQHIDPITEQGLADAWEEGRQSGAGERLRGPSQAELFGQEPNPHRAA